MTDLATPILTSELARLVWLLVYRADSVDEQKAALRAVLGAVQTSGHKITHSDLSERVAGGARLSAHPAESASLSELAHRMASHSVRALEVMPKAKAAEILALARALASDGVRDDQGAAFDDTLLALAPESISVHLGRNGFVRHATPPVGMRAVGAPPARTPPGSATAVTQDPEANDAASDDQTMLRTAFSRSFLNQPLDDLVMRLRGELGSDAQLILDEVSRYALERARHEKWLEVVDVIVKMMEREASVTSAEVKGLFVVQYRRLSTPVILKGLAGLLPREREARESVQAFFTRVGDAAADVLVDLLTTAENPTERRAYRDAILQCPAAAVPLTHQLRHPQWYVVRNAAELLGEMNMVDADTALIETLEHADARVRRAATLALIRLGTPKAVQTIVRALNDPESSVRLNAVRGLAGVSHSRAVPALLAALDAEKDDEVHQAILGALGRQATNDAVERLVREAQPAGLLKRKRPLARRLAAVTALGEASTHDARTALRGLENDRERDVRELAGKLLRDGEPGAVVIG